MHLFRTMAIAGAAAILAMPVVAQPSSKAVPAPAHSTSTKTHRLIIQVTQNDPGVMNLALNNAENLVNYYKDKGEKVDIEFVAYGAGLNMMRNDTSPVKERLSAMAANMKNVSFAGCGNTLANQSKQENKEISLVPEARIVPTGIGRVVELEEQGWTYVRP